MPGADDNNLSKYLDVFKEVGNIGAGNAASGLAGLLDMRISMSVPDAPGLVRIGRLIWE